MREGEKPVGAWGWDSQGKKGGEYIWMKRAKGSGLRAKEDKSEKKIIHKMRTYYSFAIFSILFLAGCSNKPEPSFSVSEMKCNGLENPAGTDSVPEFSWKIGSKEKEQIQTAYQIIVSSDKEIISNNRADIWDSGKNLSGESAWISYHGPELKPGKEYFWKVRVWDGNYKSSQWSSAGTFVTGLFNKKGWSDAKWIGYEDIPDSLLLDP